MVTDIQEVADCLDRTGLQFMATIGLDGRPKVRPVQFMVLEDGRLWFCTNSEKSMYAEMQTRSSAGAGFRMTRSALFGSA